MDLAVKLNGVPADSDEKFFASISVTDLSAFLKVASYKQQPNLPGMVFLEKEIKHQNGEIDEFKYASEYLSLSSSNEELDANLDVLLGMQKWRRGLLDNMNDFESLINS